MKRNNWLDGMMGLVVGDALGVPVQFMSRDTIKNRPEGPVTEMESGGVYDMPKGTWSDDSSMALAALASIIERDGINPADIMKRFVKWNYDGEYTPFGEAFDQGGTCLTAIGRFARRGNIETCGARGEYANGNGALMRILPVCLYYATGDFTVRDSVQGVHSVASLTHNHLRSNMCCGLYYFMVRSIIDGLRNETAKPALVDLLQAGIDNGLRYYGRDADNLTEMTYLGRLFDLSELAALPEGDICSTGYVIDTIEAAVWCLITTDSYEDCMLKAVNLGEDTDTVAAVAGGLAGLYYGYEAVPKAWLDEIKKREWIEGMCEGFVPHDDITTKVIDMHSHMLPDIDDGARNFEISKQMIRMAYEEGCRHLFLTPHSYCVEGNAEAIAERMNAVREWIAEEQMDLQIYPGAEIYVDPEDAEDADEILQKVKDGIYPTLNGTKYVLIEFYLGGFELDEVVPAVKKLLEAGYIPVIAHAERYGSTFDDLCYLRSIGCLLQMNICDLYYKYENDTNQMIHMLLKEKMFEFVGTDAHAITRRPPKMKEYIDFMYRNYEKEYVDSILYKNAAERFGLVIE